MNDWLTLPIRLAAVAVLGVCMWVVVAGASNQASSAFSSADGGQPVSATQADAPLAESSFPWINAGRVLPMAIVFAISFFIFYEYISYRLFVEAYRQVTKCGGTANTSIKVDWLWLHYLYCKTDVEISHTEIKEGQFPLLSQIPRLNRVRMWQVHLAEAEAEAAVKELAQCSDLQHLELSGTNFSAIDLGQAGLLESVPQVVVN